MTTKRADERRNQAATPGGAGRVAPESVEAALALAARHGRNALAEALLAGHALLDAASLALTGHPAVQARDLESTSDAVRALARIITGMDALAERLRSDEASETRRLIDALLAALDSEIKRWEREARDDADARAVLRAFLGLRELLWELGLRPGAGTEDENETAAEPTPGQRPVARRRSPRGHADAKTGTGTSRTGGRARRPGAASTSTKSNSPVGDARKGSSPPGNSPKNNPHKGNPAKSAAPPRRRRVQRVDVES